MTQPVIVLGAGIVGICTALSLVERGIPVQIIDRGAPGQETSFGNAGVISPWSFIPQSLPGTWRQIPWLMFGRYRPLSVRPGAWPRMIPWGLRFLKQGTPAKARRSARMMEVLCGPSIDLFRRHLDGTGHEGLIVDSYYVHAFRDPDRASLEGFDYQVRRDMGADQERIDAAELRRVEPALSADFKAAILIKGQARTLSPGQVGKVLADKARAAGVEFVQASIKALLQRDDGWEVLCEDGSHHARQIVVALGAWSADLLRPLGFDCPLMAERGYHLEFTQSGLTLNNSVMDVDAKFVASSMLDGLRVAGQAEFAPVDAPPSQSRMARLKKQAKATFPDLNIDNATTWMGRRPSFPDSLPMIGEDPDRKGLFLNFGHSHYGLMMAPKSGELAADLVAGRKLNLDLAGVSPTRFQN